MHSAIVVTLLLATAPPARAQPPPPAAPAAPTDPLGRDTPRGSVLNFLDAARAGNYGLAREYLDTRAPPATAERLAEQLFVVLDAKLPARLQISDKAEGARTNPLLPDVEPIGTIESRAGPVEILLNRVERGGEPPVWLFSRRTLDAVPRLHAEITANATRVRWPPFLTDHELVGLSLLEWLVLSLGIPLFFLGTWLLNRLLVALVRPLWHRFSLDRDRAITNVLPVPARMLLLAASGGLLLTYFPLSLRVRQFWSAAAGLIAVTSLVWLLIILNGEAEAALRRRVLKRDPVGMAALLRVLRRVVDVVIIMTGIAVALRYFGVESTPALAGLGVGGLAVALAAQKTLENVVAGASLLLDQAVRVGDFLRVGETVGTVDRIGLRSTRIRTLDRTIVSIPNGQVANVTVETISARDKFWFHPQLRLSYATTPLQLRAVLDGTRTLLERHRSVDPDVRVRLERLGPYSFDVEVFAYVFASNWNEFLEIQEQLLIGVTELIERAGTSLAVPPQPLPAWAERT